MIGKEERMKQPHTEGAIDHTGGEQNTGNHKKKGTPESGGADKFGGTRQGAENVESGAADAAPKGEED